MTTYEYKFVHIKYNFWTSKPKEDYKGIIQDHARQGWRLATLVPPSTHNAHAFELIFERPM